MAPERPTDPSNAPTVEASHASIQSGATIGPYRLMQRLGEGGMGDVWLAEQARPVRRQVAFKVIKLGMDSAQVIARFEAERQALALMDHPAIATVFDGGTTPEGRLFFAMEYVKGESITTYCDRHKLAVKERLGLFVQVCQGVQHAHQKGIIHRDLKPSNVLVTLVDGQPVPKIIDFGVAKAIAQQLTDRTLFTELGVMIGTPEYMSPEQAEMGGLDIDTRTDVYALGVLLYELLTGSVPSHGQTLREKGLDEIRRTIREVDPPKPSTRVIQLGSSSMSGRPAKDIEPARLAGQLRGDLDWITMKALEKDRTRRYDTVMGLAADIERHLSNQPVFAGPPSAVYRSRKFVRRHRFGVGAAAVLVVLLVAFGVTTAVQARRIAQGRDRADQEALRANKEAESAKRVSNFLVDLFKVSDPSESRGNVVTAREILDQGARRIESELATEPEVQGRLMSTMGSVYQNLGLYEQSAALLEKSLAVRLRALGERDPQIAESLLALAHLRMKTGEFDEAGRALDRAVDLRISLFGADSTEVAEVLNSQGILEYERGDLAKAEGLFRREIDLLRAKPEAGRDVMAAALNNLGMIVYDLHADYKAAKGLLQEALLLREAHLGKTHPDYAESLNNLGLANFRDKNYEAADSLFLEAIALKRKLFGNTHPEVAASLNNLSLLRGAQGRYGDAAAVLTESVAINRAALGPDHPDVALNLANLGDTLRRAGDLAGAEKVLREALVVFSRAFPTESWRQASTQSHLAICLVDRKRFVEAEALVLSAYSLLHAQFPDSHPRVQAVIGRVATLYDAWQKPAKAAEWRGKLTPRPGGQ